MPRRGRGLPRRSASGVNAPLRADALPKSLKLASLTLGVPFDGITIGYVDWGPADASRSVVCVHGLTRNARDFDVLAEALADRGLRVIAVDVVGRGRSRWLKDPSPYVVPVYAQPLNPFIDALGLGLVDWTGPS